MKAIDSFIKDHQLIFRMLKHVEDYIQKIKAENRVNPAIIDIIIDFFKAFTHRHHHGKEENILFKGLHNKNLENYESLIEKMIHEHHMLKTCIGNLVKHRKEYVTGNNKALFDIINELETLIKFYPKHLKVEDGELFPNFPDFFTAEEQEKINKEVEEYDQNMFYERYMIIVQNFDIEKQD